MSPRRPQAARPPHTPPSSPRRRQLLAVMGGLGAASVALAAEDRPTQAQVFTVTVRDYRFDPPELTVPAGSTVRWVNAEKRVSHSILFGAGGEHAGRESERLLPDEDWQLRFTRPGRNPYGCGPHPEMRGVVVVLP